jgi:hypothetical protein
MAVTTLINWILRAFQFLFGVIILGLSVTLIRGHHWGSLPSSLGYGAFLGGISILASLIGLVATWVTFLEGIVGAVLDAVVAILNIAGGIVRLALLPRHKSIQCCKIREIANNRLKVFAIKLKGVTCKISGSFDNDAKLALNDFFNGGCQKYKGKSYCWGLTEASGYSENKARNVVLGHCRESQADMVFMFLTAALFLVTAGMAFLKRRKGY